MVSIKGRSVHICNGSVTIDGRTFQGNVEIRGNKVVVNGVEQDGELIGDISITVTGNCDSVETTSGDVVIKGDAGDVISKSGDIDIEGDVRGDVKTMSGDVHAKQIHGSVSTMSGDIRGAA